MLSAEPSIQTKAPWPASAIDLNKRCSWSPPTAKTLVAKPFCVSLSTAARTCQYSVAPPLVRPSDKMKSRRGVLPRLSAPSGIRRSSSSSKAFAVVLHDLQEVRLLDALERGGNRGGDGRREVSGGGGGLWQGLQRVQQPLAGGRGGRDVAELEPGTLVEGQYMKSVPGLHALGDVPDGMPRDLRLPPLHGAGHIEGNAQLLLGRARRRRRRPGRRGGTQPEEHGLLEGAALRHRRAERQRLDPDLDSGSGRLGPGARAAH
mmetsp:Transcript_126292/g.403663  ORF Transcript_126292/g.403663 Transcript_126292/m.403663 type:complete len:261 (+) Transcript_126292:373-1155(+)